MGQDELISRMRASFEADLDNRAKRALNIQLQNFIPSHWFAAAASEYASMYVSGHFYGCISIAQAYVEALSKFLCEYHKIKATKDIDLRWQRLHKTNHVSLTVLEAAKAIFNDRNDYHHLNKEIEREYAELQRRAKDCVNYLYSIESEIFAYSFSDSEPGKIMLAKPEYWPSPSPEQVEIHLRHL